jgi:hypothetical protein
MFTERTDVDLRELFLLSTTARLFPLNLAAIMFACVLAGLAPGSLLGASLAAIVCGLVPRVVLRVLRHRRLAALDGSCRTRC